MPIMLAPILIWILTHPDDALADAVAIEESLVKAVEGAIAAWRRYKAGLLTDEQLLARWNAEGVKVDEAIAMWKNKP